MPQHYSRDAIVPGFDRKNLALCKADYLQKKAEFGEEHNDTLCAAFIIAEVLAKGKRYKDALGWYRFVFLAESQELGMENYKVLEVRNHIASVLRALDREADADRWNVDYSVGCCELLK